MTAILDRFYDELCGAWRYRRTAMSAAIVAAVGGWLVVFAMPDRFEANARVFVDTRTALRPALQGLTVDQDIGAQLNFVRQSLLAGPQLEKLATEAGLFPPGVIDERVRARILSDLADRITLSLHSASDRDDERTTAGIVYGIDYLDSDRARSLRVVDILLNTFVEQTLGGKREGSQNAQKFLEVQIGDYEQRLHAAEERLAEFKKRNVGLMPDEQGGYFMQLQNELAAAKKSSASLSVTLSRRAELVRQLHGDEAVSAAAGSAPLARTRGVAGGTDTLSRIQQTQERLDELLLNYTEKHPDVIAARETLRELEDRRALELESLRRGVPSAIAASGAGDNPVYQSIVLELNRADVEIAALRRELEQHQGTIAEMRQRLDSAPQVEAEFQQLNRDYDVNKAQYTALLANYQKARLGERADDAGSVRFEIVQPPVATLSPVWPQRALLLAGVWAAALAVGAGLAYLLHRIRPVTQSVRDLAEITARPILGIVSCGFPSRRRAELRRERWWFSAGTLLLMLALGTALLLSSRGLRLPLQALESLVAA